MRDEAKGFVALVSLGVALLVIGIVFATMWIFGVGLFQRATADFRGETQAIEDTRANSDFRLQAYDHFFDLCSSVQADERRITALEEELESGVSDKRETQIKASITAVKSSRGQKIAQYNADASKDFTVGQFRDADLPYELEEDGRTSC